MLKKSILFEVIKKKLEISVVGTKFLKFGHLKPGYSGLRNLFQVVQLDQIIFLPIFFTVILKNNVKSKKACPDFSF